MHKMPSKNSYMIETPTSNITRKTVTEITNMVGQMDPKIGDQVINYLMKSKRMPIQHQIHKL